MEEYESVEMETSTRLPRNYGVLVVDDERGVRDVLNIGMRREGFDVWLAPDGREALNVYRRHRQAIDVVLLDVCMPVLDGPQTLVALKELTPHIPCCFMSGDLGAYTEERLRNLGAATVLQKPFRLAEVASVLSELAGKAHSGSSHAARPPAFRGPGNP